MTKKLAKLNQQQQQQQHQRQDSILGLDQAPQQQQEKVGRSISMNVVLQEELLEISKVTGRDVITVTNDALNSYVTLYNIAKQGGTFWYKVGKEYCQIVVPFFAGLQERIEVLYPEYKISTKE